MLSMSRRLVLGAISGLSLSGAASAQSVEDFYKGKQVQMLVFSGAGSTYDT